MHRAGVKILAGTDTYNAYCFPGFSVHDELELFVEAGMSPSRSTSDGHTQPCSLSQSFATRSVPSNREKIADLVLLDANPLVTIGNTRKIAGVVVNGKYLSSDSLRRMLADVEAIASQK